MKFFRPIFTAIVFSFCFIIITGFLSMMPLLRKLLGPVIIFNPFSSFLLAIVATRMFYKKSETSVIMSFFSIIVPTAFLIIAVSIVLAPLSMGLTLFAMGKLFSFGYGVPLLFGCVASSYVGLWARKVVQKYTGSVASGRLKI